MIPATFEYVRARSVREAISLLQQHGGRAKLLAGGHSLLPLMKLRLSQPEMLIDLGPVDELRGIREEGGSLVIGALTTHDEVANSPLVRERVPLLAECASQIGDVQVRNRGTIGGNLAHADPAADYPAAALALEAQLECEGPAGSRTVPASQWFVDLLTTALGPDEVLCRVRVPVQTKGQGWSYIKLPHPASGYSLLGVACLVTVDGGVCRDARVAVTGAGPKAVRLTKVEQALVGKRLEEAAVAEAARLASDGLEASDDLYASAEYKRHLAVVYTKRALLRAAERAAG
ncbi:MAG: xanthine dehydrogenase family protein subunit M [Armatimonadota bacterium]|nr:xanthine dehydrogenase family protein subunit M [Armatimonadota bacterium]MDR5677030.1 xanthine dehydrogenase family protein subunit M [Armatimonadota bacterium]MDR5688668.1 xanthine dehydrogenase family protein subunit M [Armatimonadota bacterium]MDR7391003.1 xanthine dehydrogenase family protein subunit M [Armatimonadota bacterium]MDR7405208.1 xanthine dehydrogenase family protein subunit M [Armatimonadota bacterium]